LKAGIASTKFSKIPPSLGEVKFSVGSTSNSIGVVIILAIVFPVAHGAQVESTSLVYRVEAAAWARILGFAGRLDDIHEWHVFLLVRSELSSP